ncbi:hypothetical protein Peur_038830 [Populus x canadensis]
MKEKCQVTSLGPFFDTKWPQDTTFSELYTLIINMLAKLYSRNDSLVQNDLDVFEQRTHSLIITLMSGLYKQRH